MGTNSQSHAPPVLFDLDGTLADSVYQHVLAWRAALEEAGINLAVWRIHRRIGMSGGLFVNALLRETGRKLSTDQVKHLQQTHSQAYLRQIEQVRPLPGSRELLAQLSELAVPWAIATSGSRASAGPTLEVLQVPKDAIVVTRDDVRFAKPDPDLFIAAANRLDVDAARSVIVGDSVWDMLAARRAGGLGVGVQSGGYGREELERAGAYRVYEDPADLGRHLDEIGIRVAI